MLYIPNDAYAHMTEVTGNPVDGFTYAPGPDCTVHTSHACAVGSSSDGRYTALASYTTEPGVTVVDIFDTGPCSFTPMRPTLYRNLVLIESYWEAIGITNNGKYLVGVQQDETGQYQVSFRTITGDNAEINNSKVILGYVNIRPSPMRRRYCIECVFDQDRDALLVVVAAPSCDDHPPKMLFQQRLHVEASKIYKPGLTYRQVLSDMWSRDFQLAQVQSELEECGFIYNELAVKEQFSIWGDAMYRDLIPVAAEGTKPDTEIVHEFTISFKGE